MLLKLLKKIDHTMPTSQQMRIIQLNVRFPPEPDSTSLFVRNRSALLTVKKDVEYNKSDGRAWGLRSSASAPLSHSHSILDRISISRSIAHHVSQTIQSKPMLILPAIRMSKDISS